MTKTIKKGNKVLVKENAREICKYKGFPWGKPKERMVGKVCEVAMSYEKWCDVFDPDKLYCWSFPLEALELVEEEPKLKFEDVVRKLKFGDIVFSLELNKEGIIYQTEYDRLKATIFIPQTEKTAVVDITKLQLIEKAHLTQESDTEEETDTLRGIDTPKPRTLRDMQVGDLYPGLILLSPGGHRCEVTEIHLSYKNLDVDNRGYSGLLNYMSGWVVQPQPKSITINGKQYESTAELERLEQNLESIREELASIPVATQDTDYIEDILDRYYQARKELEEYISKLKQI